MINMFIFFFCMSFFSVTCIASKRDFHSADMTPIENVESNKINVQIAKILRKCGINDKEKEDLKSLSKRAIEIFHAHPDGIGTEWHDGKMLLWAVKRNEIDFARYLLEKGANANADHGIGSDCNPPFLWATSGDMAQLLIGHGATNSIQDHGLRLLCVSILRIAPSMISWLVQQSVDVNACYEGMPPLMHLAFAAERCSDNSLALRAQHLIESSVSLVVPLGVTDHPWHLASSPQLIKGLIRSELKVIGGKVERFQALRAALIKFSRERNENRTKEIEGLFASEESGMQLLPRVLARVVVQYDIEDYERLEAEKFAAIDEEN